MSHINSLTQAFSTENLITFLRSAIPSFKPDSEDLSYLFPEDIYEKYESIEKIGEAVIDNDDLIVIASKTNELLTERTGKKNQYEIAKKILKQEVKDASLFIFYDDEGNFRFSFVRANYLGTKRDFTDFKRYTYFVSPNQTNKTFIKQIEGCNFSSLDAIIEAFSVEPLNKQFYQDIVKSFYGLIGGKVKIGSRNEEFDTILSLPSTPVNTSRKAYQEFAVRLIGRTIFCWFLKSKKSERSVPLVPDAWLSSKAVAETSNYYHSVLEKLFFLVLNQKHEDRKAYDLPSDHHLIPFLNGGLFEPLSEDSFINNQANFALKIPDEWFKNLFETLEQYNFTIDENSIYDAEVSIDPEMLGTIFENLLAEIDPDTEKSARKSTGSFYTPREIVDYMVEQSLVQYLKTKTGIEDEEQLMELFKEGGENKFDHAKTKTLLDALYNVKILDPACGSGAFPMGAVSKIISALQKLDPDATLWKAKQIENVPNPLARKILKEKLDTENADYIRKLGVIQNSIYGVDIQPIAAEISKLRSFLSLVIDETINDQAHNRGIQALPNLEFKFVTANTLIGLEEKQQQGVLDFGHTDALQHQLKNIRSHYLQAYGDEKEQLKKDFKKAQAQIFKNEIANASGENKRALQLASWKPFGNESNNWFDPYWMFGVEKFDIVIGNPPYVDSETMVLRNNAFRNELRSLYEFAKGNWDLFIIFIEKGLKLTKSNGVFTYIVPNKLISSKYAEKARDNINQLNLIEIRDYSRINVFVSADVYPITILIQNNIPKKGRISKFTVMSNLIEESTSNHIEFDDSINDSFWDKYFFDSNILEVIVKLDKLKKFETSNATITGAATVSEAYKIKDVLIDKENQKDSFKLINTGTIDPYQSLWSVKKTQYIKHNYEYPRVKYADLKSINEVRFNQSRTPKIIIAGMSNKIEAYFDKKGEYLAGKSTTIIIDDIEQLKYYYGLLNSKLISFYIDKVYYSLKMAGGYLNISTSLIKSIPLPKFRSYEIIKTASQILKREQNPVDIVSLIEKNDILIYKDFNLSFENVLIIDPNFNLTKEEYDNYTIG